MAASAPGATLHMSEQEFLDRYADLKPPYEFVNGEVTQKPMTKREHYLLAEELLMRLGLYRRSQREGSSGPDPTVYLGRGSDRRYRVPDVAYYAPGKPRGGTTFLPPTLAIEIQSPGQTLRDLRAKCREYRERGVDLVWLVLPYQRVVEVFEGEVEAEPLPPDGVLASEHLPGFQLPVAELFAALDETPEADA